MQLKTQKLNKVAYLLMVILTCECVFGSSGRWLEIGGLSVRMVLYILAFIASLPFVLRNLKMLVNNIIVISIFIFGLFICFSLVIGNLNGNPSEFILTDLTSLLFLLIVPGYIVIINTENRLKALIKYANYFSLALACITIILHFVLLVLSKDEETALNVVVNDLGVGGFFGFGDGIYRIYFRSSVCFILPFIYNLNLLIKNDRGNDRKKLILPYIFMSVSLIAIVLTYTRSIWLGAVGGVLFFCIVNIRNYKILLKGIAVSLAGFCVFLMVSWASYGFEGVVTNSVNRVLIMYDSVSAEPDLSESEYLQLSIEKRSDMTREERMDAVVSSIKDNWVLGCGLGKNLDVSKGSGKIEYTYLDFLNKMGIFGFISFLAMLLLPFCLAWKGCRRKHNGRLAAVMLSVMVCIYVSSFFNPYLTSPIGFSIFAALAASINVKCANLQEQDSVRQELYSPPAPLAGKATYTVSPNQE